MIKRILAATAAVLAATAPAFAHLDPVEHGSFAAGFTHPLFGLDHILAMVAVGLWAASIGARENLKNALWIVPAAFVVTMAIGFGAAIIGLPMPFVEPVILASVIFIGIMVALALPLPVLGVAAVVAFFAFFHGHAHGEEMGDAGAWGYAAGFVAATIVLHAAGVALGLLAGRLLTGARGAIFTRIAGVVTALGGIWIAIAG